MENDKFPITMPDSAIVTRFVVNGIEQNTVTLNGVEKKLPTTINKGDVFGDAPTNKRKPPNP